MVTQQQSRFLAASKTPIQDIERVTYPGQDPARRMYRPGYEDLFNELPALDPEDPLLDEKVRLSAGIMAKIADRVVADGWAAEENKPGENGFNRTILGLESPIMKCSGHAGGSMVAKEGSEVVMARWGNGHTSPVHGHAPGYLHEEILFGKMRVNTYRIVDSKYKVVRPISTQIVGPGTFASLYTMPSKYYFTRNALVHNFTSIGFSASLHYLPEHTRDGRDNRYTVEHFSESFWHYMPGDLTRISGQEGMYLRPGDVALVRSSNVPEYGDHYIVITGAPVMKEHGLRPQDVAVMASPADTKILDQYEPMNGLTILKLNGRARQMFHRFHGIHAGGGEVRFPDPYRQITF